MQSRLEQTAILMMFGMLVTCATVGYSQGSQGSQASQGAAASWLDEAKIAAWNTAGQPIPAARKGKDAVNPRLAPKPMDSRTDGALAQVMLQSPAQLTAEYTRYDKADALCCPSRTTRVTFDIAKDPPVVRAGSASTSKNQSAGTPGAHAAR